MTPLRLSTHIAKLQRTTHLSELEDRPMKIIAITTLCSAVTLCAPGMPARCHAQSPNVTVFASGLAGPRGLKFGPDGDLYVAEAGFGGTNATTSSQCTQEIGRASCRERCRS